MPEANWHSVHAAAQIDALRSGTYDAKTATHAIIGVGIIHALLAINDSIRAHR